MITDPQGTVLALVLAFCRIGACVMVLPGFSSTRVPPQVRLFIAVAVSLAVLPVLWDAIYPRVTNPGPAYAGLIVTETAIGLVYGLIARIYTLGMQFAGGILVMSIGFSAPGGQDPVEDTPDSPLTSLLSMSGLLLLFILDFHHVVFRALIDSYAATPLGAVIDPRRMLITLTDTLRASTSVMLRLASPFLIYGLMFNLAIGMINKLSPQIPVYFISAPFLLAGGLFLLALSIAALVRQYADGFAPIFMGF